VRFDAEHRIVALGLAGTVQALAILCLAVGYREPGLASMAVVLASDLASFVHGATLDVNGGMYMA